MQAIRHLLAQRRLVVLLCAATMLLKLAVPYGYMIDTGHGRLAVVPCAGTVPPPETATAMHAAHAAHGKHGAEHGGTKDHGKADQPCAFAGLSAAALGTIDPVQLAALIAFVVATGLIPGVLPAPAALPRLRPPSHGPPVTL